ncbi:DEAD/DEAH box helicase [Orbaceae bacterium ESL0721]|nr:DEAD/DEAH box helicase [Orbaceae bacterium ESL0721]
MKNRTFTPRPYQNLIVNHQLEIPRGNTWAGMGMGKTSSTLCALDIAYMSGYYTEPTLVIAPLRVAQSTWPDELIKWDFKNISIQPIIGNSKQRADALKNPNANVFTTNYENLPWLVETLGAKWPFKQIIADESTKLKSFRLRGGGTRAASLRNVAFKKVNFWQNLTGTPAPNGLIDLWGQNWFIDGGQRLGRTIEAFTDRWFNKIPIGDFYKIEPAAFAQEQIQNALRDVCITLDAKDWFDIKDPITTQIYVELPDKIKKQYKQLEKEMFLELGNNEIEAHNAASKTIKCLQFANGALYIDSYNSFTEVHDLKIQALESIISESNGMPVLVAYHFKHDEVRLLKAFKQARVLDNNPQTIKDWNNGKIPILLAHPDSAGHGLNLQDGGNILVYFAHWWNLESSDQILERIGPTRQAQSGYNRPVFIYEIIAKGTVDEDVIARKKTKRNIQDILRESMKRRGCVV